MAESELGAVVERGARRRVAGRRRRRGAGGGDDRRPRCARRRCPIRSGTRSLAATAGSARTILRWRSGQARWGRTARRPPSPASRRRYLWVRGADEVCDAVRDCWASLYSAPAISYRARLGGAGRPAMGVTVQVMVDAEVSGVMFTCNPVSGDPAWSPSTPAGASGLAVVGGEVTPDDYLVSKVTREVVREQLSDKAVQYVPRPDGHGAEKVEVAPERREVACLDAGALSDAGGRGPPGPGPLRLATRTSSGRSTTAVSCSWSSRARSPPRSPPCARTSPGCAASALSMVMNQFGAGRSRAMALSHDDVREILRIIDESDLDELRLETEGFSLHVRKGGAARPRMRMRPILNPNRGGGAGRHRRPDATRPMRTRLILNRRTGWSRSRRRCSGPSTGPSRPAPRRSSRSGRGWSPTPSCASSRS